MNDTTTKRRKTEKKSLPSLLVSGCVPVMLLMGASTALCGTAAACLRGNLEVLPATLCLIFVLLTQIGSTYWHRYIDIKRHYWESADDSDFDEISGELPDSTVFREAAVAVFMMDAIIALSLLAMAGWWLLAFGAALAAVIYLTFGGPKPLTHSPAGVVSTFLVFGPIGVIGISMVQSAHESYSLLNEYDLMPALILSAVTGLMAVCCNLIYNSIHQEDNRKVGKRTVVTVYGRQAARTAYALCSVAAAVAFSLGCAYLHAEEWYLMYLLPALWLAGNLWLMAMRRKATDTGLSRIQFLVNLNMFLFSLACLVISLFIGNPDDSAMRFF